ncbi:MAG: S8 family serine peptidase [Bacteroidales bacterium]|jgi:subtilisin family serine protease
MQQKIWILLFVLAIPAGCSRDVHVQGPAEVFITETFQTDKGNVTALKGHIRVKTEKELSSTKAADNLFPNLKITSIRRTFPYCGKFEARTHAEGLDLWYDITFAPSVPLTKARETIAKTKGITYIEYIHPLILEEDTVYPFNDPMLSKQWHYNNPGTLKDYLSGADINLFSAWEISAGSRDVIVAVLDNGVQWDHEDLADNMWVNEAEYYGASGHDDDNNGYIDDIYGYNFTVATNNEMAGTIEPGNHGTHVAGIISAVNNNGIGTCGVAGGNGKTRGARIMSCQIMDNAGYPASAMKYAADNGAIISQNSWSSEDKTLDASMKEAIDYFVKYAGVDENDVQTGPMRGGIVIFAAGNDNIDFVNPGMYEGVMAVAALGPGYKKASYSNYGNWVDIVAPGGDDVTLGNAYVYSCIAGNSYGGMMGTSQACPHVSGVAALVLSQFGKEGFTNKMLWDILVNSTTNVDSYNPGYSGRMGSGLVDAYRCLASEGPLAPSPISHVNAKALSNSITLTWTVPNDEDSGKAFAYDIFASTHPIELADLQLPLREDMWVKTVYSGQLTVGDTISTTLSDLAFNTDYYFRLVAYDNHNHRSAPTDCIKQTTLGNHAPVITPVNGTSLSLKAFETKTLTFILSEPDAHEISFQFIAGSKAASASLQDNLITISVSGVKAPAGSYTASLVVSDSYGASSTQEITYTIVPNQPPVVVFTPENIYMGRKSEVKTIDLSSCFSDPDGEPLSFTVTSSTTGNIVKTTLNGNTLNIQGINYGTASLTVTASDALGADTHFSIKVLLRDENHIVDLYPNPVKDILNIRLGEMTSVDISITSSVGVQMYKATSVAISPFQPAQVNMASFSGGVYSVSINFKGGKIIRNIVKL